MLTVMQCSIGSSSRLTWPYQLIQMQLSSSLLSLITGLMPGKCNGDVSQPLAGSEFGVCGIHTAAQAGRSRPVAPHTAVPPGSEDDVNEMGLGLRVIFSETCLAVPCVCLPIANELLPPTTILIIYHSECLLSLLQREACSHLYHSCDHDRASRFFASLGTLAHSSCPVTHSAFCRRTQHLFLPHPKPLPSHTYRLSSSMPSKTRSTCCAVLTTQKSKSTSSRLTSSTSLSCLTCCATAQSTAEQLLPRQSKLDNGRGICATEGCYSLFRLTALSVTKLTRPRHRIDLPHGIDLFTPASHLR